MSLDDVGYDLSWTDLRAFLEWPVPGSRHAHVLENPPVDPATVPTKTDVVANAERLKAKRKRLAAAGAKTQASNLSEKQVKKQAKG